MPVLASFNHCFSPFCRIPSFSGRRKRRPLPLEGGVKSAHSATLAVYRCDTPDVHALADVQGEDGVHLQRDGRETYTGVYHLPPW